MASYLKLQELKVYGYEVRYVIEGDILVYWFNSSDEDEDLPVITDMFFVTPDEYDNIPQLISTYMRMKLNVSKNTKIRFSSTTMADSALAILPSGGAIRLDNITVLLQDSLLRILDDECFNYQKLYI